MLDNQNENIDKEYRKILVERFSHGSKNAKALYIKYVQYDSIGSLDYPDVPCYNTYDNKIYLNASMDLVNPRGAGVTWFHEHGHYIDAALGYISDDDVFRKLLDQDVLKLRDKFSRKFHLLTLDKVDVTISNEMFDMRLHSAVSDLMDGITQGQITSIAGHSNNYWKQDKYTINREAFAHMFECQFDKERYNEMKKYFPKSLIYFEKILKKEKN
ncbi:MAG: hypothetical protein LUG60_00460 [Erysipelotrichaceae bacterium]|nr:hypothetical protein [Erysipelotrichaceae bacterium]